MYRQILIREKYCVYQHILWYYSPSNEVQEFEHLTITYEISSTSYLAIRCLHKLDEKYGIKFPLTKDILTMYMILLLGLTLRLNLSEHGIIQLLYLKLEVVNLKKGPAIPSCIL